MIIIIIALLIVSALSNPSEFFAFGSLSHPHLPLPVIVIHQFPAGTWIESLAIRNNGKILTTALSSPEIVQVDNHGKKPSILVHTFANATTCTGIVHLGKDTFYFIAGNFTLSTLTPVPGSWSVYRVDMRHHHPHHTEPKPAKVSWVANIPDAIFLKGITILDKWQETFLLSDSGAGVVYRLDGKTGRVLQVIDDPLMKPSSSASFGVGISGVRLRENGNELSFTKPSFAFGIGGIGIKKHANTLYFTNRNQGLVARIRIFRLHPPHLSCIIRSLIMRLI